MVTLLSPTELEKFINENNIDHLLTVPPDKKYWPSLESPLRMMFLWQTVLECSNSNRFLLIVDDIDWPEFKTPHLYQRLRISESLDPDFYNFPGELVTRESIPYLEHAMLIASCFEWDFFVCSLDDDWSIHSSHDKFYTVLGDPKMRDRVNKHIHEELYEDTIQIIRSLPPSF